MRSTSTQQVLVVLSHACAKPSRIFTPSCCSRLPQDRQHHEASRNPQCYLLACFSSGRYTDGACPSTWQLQVLVPTKGRCVEEHADKCKKMIMRFRIFTGMMLISCL